MKRIYAKTTHLVGSKDYLRYLITGGLNTVLTFVIYSAGVYVGIHYNIAYLIAWCVGVLVSFYLSSTFVFRKQLAYKRFFKFVLSYLASLLISEVMLTVLISMFLMHKIVAAMVTIPFVVCFNYLVGKFLIFHHLSGD